MGPGIGVLVPGWDPDSHSMGIQSGDSFVPWRIPGCALAACTNSGVYGSTVVAFPADPCVNGTFAVDATWAKGADWTINGGVAKHAAVGANDLTQACLTVGNTFIITYTVTQQTAGNITVYAGTTAGTARTAPGTYTETLLCAGNTTLAFKADAACDAWIDNVVLQPRNAASFTDLSGNGHHPVQATANKQPLWVASGSGGVLRFDGTDDYLKAAAFTLDQPAHVFVLGKYTTGAGTAYLWDGNAADKGACYRVAAPNNNSYVYAGGGAAISLASANSTWYVYDATYNGASSLAGLNGAVPSGANIGANNPGGFTLCAAGSGNARIAADIAAVIVFSRALAEPDRQRVVRWLNRQKAMLAL
ncbi:MAG: hypothetical protein WC683_09495 [bacterium]